jgi:hypothetical protein
MITRSAAPHLHRCLVLLFGLLSLRASAQEVAATAATPAEPALAPTASEAGVRAIVSSQSDTLGRRCELHGVASGGALRFLACGVAGLWVIRVHPDGSANLLAQRDLGGSTSGFFVRDGKLWVEITSRSAQLLELPGDVNVSPSAPTSPAIETRVAPPPAAAPAPVTPNRFSRFINTEPQHQEGVVKSVEPGSVVVTLGSADGVHAADHVAFYDQKTERFSETESAVQRTLLAVGNVVSVTEGHARVQLGLNEQMPVGTLAVRTEQPLTAALFAPPRAAGIWEVGFMARPFIVLDNLGFGAFLDARVGMRLTVPVHLEALLSPLGFATAKGGTTFPAAGVITASYDTRLFEVGLGVGGQTVNEPDISLDPGSGLVLAQRVRLGSRDGAHIEAISYVALFHSDFSFGNLRVQGQVPVGERTWLIAAGGGGNVGLGFGEIGLRVLMTGNGGPGSFFLSSVIGGVNVFRGCVVQGTECTQIDYVGPMVGMGGDWRL